MKKSLFLIVLALISFGGLNIRFNDYQAISEKIVFEDDFAYHDMSLEESKNTEIKGRSVFVQLHLDYNKKTKDINLDDDATPDEIKEAKENRREELSEYYYRKNRDRVSRFDFKRSSHVYISKYGPFIEYEYTYENYVVEEEDIVDMIIDEDTIEKAIIGYSDTTIEDEVYFALHTSNAVSYYEERNFTGADVTIGILETGIMDTSHSNFTNTDCITYDDPWWIDSVTDHATMTASIIGGSGGCAPDAKLLSAAAHGTYVNEIEWMIDNDVNIINMSFGEALTYGTRTSRTEYVDYIIQQYDICVVASSGNTDDGSNYKVANPGMAYNAITVGSVTPGGYRKMFSKYQVTEGMPKPTVVVEGENFNIPGIDGTHSGTSVSAALVTGMIAIFMDNYYVLTIQIPRIMSLLCNGAYYMPSTLTQRNLNNNFNDELGAGIVSLSDSIHTSRYGVNITNDGDNPSGIVYRENFTLKANTNYKLALAWFFGEKGVQGSEAHTSYFMGVVDAYGNPYYYTYGTNSNVMVLDFTPTYEMDVSLVIEQISTNLVNGTEDLYLSKNMHSLSA